MEIDLDHLQQAAEPFRSQVCVVGAGIAGMTLARRLSERGVHVALLEAGGHSTARPIDTDGELRVFGGNSLRWGGQLLPLPEDAGWPVTNAELAPYEREAERMLGVDALPYAATPFFAAMTFDRPSMLNGASEGVQSGLMGRISKWVPFARRNLAQAWGRELLRSPRCTCYLHAEATELLPSTDGTRITAVLARNSAGTLFRFEAEEFVLATGTAQVAPLVRALNNPHVGANLHDHLTVPVAEFTGPARKRILRQLRPWRAGRIWHSAKMEASPALRERLALPPMLAHVVIEESEESGVSAVRSLLTARQQGSSRNIARLPRTLVHGTLLLWQALVHRRRYVSSRARVRLVINAAAPTPAGAEDLDAIRRFADSLRQRFTRWEGILWQPALAHIGLPLQGLDDARHLMGGACMGTDPGNSVVDAELRVHGLANLSIASAAVFPSGAPPLPTLPLMALTLRVAERLINSLLSQTPNS